MHRFAIATLTALGMMALTATSASALQLGECNPQEDPDNCQCPSNLASYESCNVTGLDNLIEFDDPSAVDTSFISTSYDSEEDNYDVVIDLRQVNGAGLVPQLDNQGEWDSIAQLKSYIAELTGVPATEDERLMPFNVTQIGYATPVTSEGFAAYRFNDFILDLITDQYGQIHVNGATFDLAAMEEKNRGGWQGDDEMYLFDETLSTDVSCVPSQKIRDNHSLEATQCSLVEAKSLGDNQIQQAHGMYNVWTEIKNVKIDGQGTQRLLVPSPTGPKVRTLLVFADLSIRSEIYWEYYGSVSLSNRSPLMTGPLYTPYLRQSEDRMRTRTTVNPQLVADGICSDPGTTSAALGNGITLPLSIISGDGAVPSNSACPQ